MDKPQYEQKEGYGAAFKNDFKKNERQPDWSGTFTWKGEELQVAFWERESKKGTRYLSLQVSPKFQPTARAMQKAAGRTSSPPDDKPELDDPIPF